MHFLKYIFLFLSISSFSQEEIILDFIEKTPLKASLISKLDTFGTLFYTQNNSLIKKDNNGELRYSNIQLGNITSVDTYNPLKINAFYRDFNTVVILDNRLAEITLIDFNTLSPYRNITHVSVANDNTVWVFNQDAQQLEVYDYKNDNTRVETLPIQGEVLDLKSNFNLCWVITKTHIYSYNYFGSLISKTENNGFTRLAESNENLVFLKEGKLYLKTKNSSEFQLLKLPELLINQFFVTDETLYIYDGDFLYKYHLKIQ